MFVLLGSIFNFILKLYIWLNCVFFDSFIVFLILKFVNKRVVELDILMSIKNRFFFCLKIFLNVDLYLNLSCF